LDYASAQYPSPLAAPDADDFSENEPPVTLRKQLETCRNIFRIFCKDF